MATNRDFGAFDDFFEAVLESEPQTAYMGALGRQQMPQGYSAPMQQRAQDYWRGQMSDVYNQYLGLKGQEISQRKDPSQWTSFTDYLEKFPFTQRYSALSPYERGMSTRRFAPSTRHIYF